jgi:hypothetical protein
LRTSYHFDSWRSHQRYLYQIVVNTSRFLMIHNTRIFPANDDGLQWKLLGPLGLQKNCQKMNTNARTEKCDKKPTKSISCSFSESVLTICFKKNVVPEMHI